MVNYDEWTNADLQAELESRGLETTGTKAEMAARLRTDDAGDPPEDDAEVTPEEAAADEEPKIEPPEVPLDAVDPEYREAAKEGQAAAVEAATAAEAEFQEEE